MAGAEDTCQMSPLLFESDSEEWPHAIETKLPAISNEPTDTPIPNNQELFQILSSLRQKNSLHETPKLFGRHRNFSQPLLEILNDKSTPDRSQSSPNLKFIFTKNQQSQILQKRRIIRHISKDSFSSDDFRIRPKIKVEIDYRSSDTDVQIVSDSPDPIISLSDTSDASDFERKLRRLSPDLFGTSDEEGTPIPPNNNNNYKKTIKKETNTMTNLMTGNNNGSLNVNVPTEKEDIFEITTNNIFSNILCVNSDSEMSPMASGRNENASKKRSTFLEGIVSEKRLKSKDMTETNCTSFLNETSILAVPKKSTHSVEIDETQQPNCSKYFLKKSNNETVTKETECYTINTSSSDDIIPLSQDNEKTPKRSSGSWRTLLQYKNSARKKSRKSNLKINDIYDKLSTPKSCKRPTTIITEKGVWLSKKKKPDDKNGRGRRLDLSF